MAALTGRDSFLLGPSGFGFLHPGAIPHSDARRAVFVNYTIAAAELLGTDAYVHWDDYGNMLDDSATATTTEAEGSENNYTRGQANLDTHQVDNLESENRLQRSAMRVRQASCIPCCPPANAAIFGGRLSGTCSNWICGISLRHF